MDATSTYKDTVLASIDADDDDAVVLDLTPSRLIKADARLAAIKLSAHEARYLVDTYYQKQEDRKRSTNQVRALSESGEPGFAVAYLAREARVLEEISKYMLGEYAASQPIGEWAQSITGIGPVISAGLMAYIDIEQAPTVGHIWRHAGLDPTQQWLGSEKVRAIVNTHLSKKKPTEDDVRVIAAKVSGLNAESALRIATTKRDGSEQKLTADGIIKAFSRRPWNAQLKQLCWKVGECFVKFSNHPSDIYGKVYAERKAQETEKNVNKDYADQASVGAARVGKSTDAYTHYSTGMLPPAQIHARAKRYAVKLFLAHWHHVAYESHFGTPPPKPYVLEHMGHAHYIAPPNWPLR